MDVGNKMTPIASKKYIDQTTVFDEDESLEFKNHKHFDAKIDWIKVS